MQGSLHIGTRHIQMRNPTDTLPSLQRAAGHAYVVAGEMLQEGIRNIRVKIEEHDIGLRRMRALPCKLGCVATAAAKPSASSRACA